MKSRDDRERVFNEDNPDLAKGAVEQDRRSQQTNTSLSGQLPHRTDNPLVKASDSDFPEPGDNEEHTGEPAVSGVGPSPDPEIVDQDPGETQKRNQGEEKDDPLAA
jgi:hypothetical protein